MNIKPLSDRKVQIISDEETITIEISDQVNVFPLQIKEQVLLGRMIQFWEQFPNKKLFRVYDENYKFIYTLKKEKNNLVVEDVLSVDCEMDGFELRVCDKKKIDLAYGEVFFYLLFFLFWILYNLLENKKT